MFSIALWLILVIAAVIIWQVARATGAIDNLESFLGELLADKSFQLDGGQLLRAAGLSGLVLVVAGTGFTVLLGAAVQPHQRAHRRHAAVGDRARDGPPTGRPTDGRRLVSGGDQVARTRTGTLRSLLS